MTMDSNKAIIVSNQCVACKILLEKLKTKGTLGKYKIIEAHSTEGIDTVRKLGIISVPDCIVIVKDKKGEQVRRCTDQEVEEIFKEASK